MGLPGRDNLECHSLAQSAEAHIIIVNLSMSLEYQISIIYVVNNNVTIFSPTHCIINGARSNICHLKTT